MAVNAFFEDVHSSILDYPQLICFSSLWVMASNIYSNPADHPVTIPLHPHFYQYCRISDEVTNIVFKLFVIVSYSVRFFSYFIFLFCVLLSFVLFCVLVTLSTLNPIFPRLMNLKILLKRHIAAKSITL